MQKTYFTKELANIVGVHYIKRTVERNESMPIPKTIEEFKARSIQMFEMTIRDPVIIKGRKLLTMEQFRNEKTVADATTHLFLMSLNRNRAFLTAVMEAGLLKKTDIDVLETANKYIDYFISLFGNEEGN